MKKTLLNEINENRSRLMIAAIAVLVLTVVILGVHGVSYILVRAGDGSAEAVLSQIVYTEAAAEAELVQLEQCVGGHHTEKVLGRLYKAMAELSYMTHDDMVYNEYMGKALFYTQRTGDSASYVYLSNKYIGRLYANGCYDSALWVLERLADRFPVSSYSADMQASYYLSMADILQMLGEDPSAGLDSAAAAISLMDEGGDWLLCQAKYNILTARDLIGKGDFDGAAGLMAEYSPEDDFGLGHNQVYVVCDFLIPYYEISAKLALWRQDYTAADEMTDKYMELCDSYLFRAMKLNLIEYMYHNSPDSRPDGGRYSLLREQVAMENVDEMTAQYGQFLLDDIADTTAGLSEEERLQDTLKRNMTMAAVFVYAAVALFFFVSLLVSHISRDGLTGLNNRRKYEKMQHQLEKRGVPYCLLVLDIDDFKKVNDTFGHVMGDKVLRDISDILHRFTGRGIFAYRYGGEELCLIMVRVPEARVREISEEIRGLVEATVSDGAMTVTVSGGVGVSHGGENVFQEADHRLYEAKRNGKNHIR